MDKTTHKLLSGFPRTLPSGGRIRMARTACGQTVQNGTYTPAAGLMGTQHKGAVIGCPECRQIEGLAPLPDPEAFPWPEPVYRSAQIEALKAQARQAEKRRGELAEFYARHGCGVDWSPAW